MHLGETDTFPSVFHPSPVLLGFYTLSFYDIRQLSDPLRDALNSEVQLGSHTVS